MACEYPHPPVKLDITLFLCLQADNNHLQLFLAQFRTASLKSTLFLAEELGC